MALDILLLVHKNSVTSTLSVLQFLKSIRGKTGMLNPYHSLKYTEFKLKLTLTHNLNLNLLTNSCLAITPPFHHYGRGENRPLVH